MSERLIRQRLGELRRTRWVLWALGVACCLAGFGAGPLLWGLGVVFLVLAVRTEVVIRQGERLLR